MESVVSAGDWRIEREGTMGLLFLVYWCDLKSTAGWKQRVIGNDPKSSHPKMTPQSSLFSWKTGGDCKTGAWRGIILFIFIFFSSLFSAKAQITPFSLFPVSLVIDISCHFRYLPLPTCNVVCSSKNPFSWSPYPPANLFPVLSLSPLDLYQPCFPRYIKSVFQL